MKIGILIDRLNVGGVEKIAIEQVRALRKLGEDAYLVVLRQKSVVANPFPDLINKVPIVYLDQRLPAIFRLSFGMPVFHFFSLFHITYPFFLPWVVKKNEFDYFIVHGTYTSFTAASLKRFNKIRFSAFIWDPTSYILGRVYKDSAIKPVMGVFTKIAYAVDKFLINDMDTVLVGGKAHNSFIRKISPKKPIKIIYPSVNPAAKTLNKEKYVVMVTAWKAGKNPEYILELLKRLPGIKIKMVGKWLDPEYRKSFEKLVKDSKAGNQLEIVGEVSETRMAKLCAKATVLLQTNDDRGFGMPAMEAAGNGTTFIIPKGQGVCSLFKDGEDGFYTKEKDTETITSILKRLMTNEHLATTMGKHAWEKVKNNYSWEKHAQELVSLVEAELGTDADLRLRKSLANNQ